MTQLRNPDCKHEKRASMEWCNVAISNRHSCFFPSLLPSFIVIAESMFVMSHINLLTPIVNYSGRTAPLTSKVAFYIFIQQGTEYFKHRIYSPFFSLQNAVCFIILTYLVPVLFTFYIQGVLKLKKNNSGAKRLTKFYLKYVSSLTTATWVVSFNHTKVITWISDILSV